MAQHDPEVLSAEGAGREREIGLPEAEDLAAHARECGVVAMAGHLSRYSPAVASLKRRVDDGDLPIRHLIASMGTDKRLNRNWKGQERDWVDDLVWHHGMHVLDVIMHLHEHDTLVAFQAAESALRDGEIFIETLVSTAGFNDAGNDGLWTVADLGELGLAIGGAAAERLAEALGMVRSGELDLRPVGAGSTVALPPRLFVVGQSILTAELGSEVRPPSPYACVRHGERMVLSCRDRADSL